MSQNDDIKLNRTIMDCLRVLSYEGFVAILMVLEKEKNGLDSESVRNRVKKLLQKKILPETTFSTQAKKLSELGLIERKKRSDKCFVCTITDLGRRGLEIYRKAAEFLVPN